MIEGFIKQRAEQWLMKKGRKAEYTFIFSNDVIQ